VLGVHVPPGTYVNAPVHGWAAVTRKQLPVHGWQHEPVPGGHGFGVQPPALLATVPVGHGVPSGTVEQAPVVGLQHTCVVVVTHGVICAHVSPSEKISGGGQCEMCGWMVHSPVEGSQHAPCVPGGHGFGLHEVAENGIVPVGQVVPPTIAHAPVVGSQHRTLGGTHGFAGTHVEPVPPHTPGAGQAAALATIVHTVTPAAFTVQQAPWLPGGHGFGVHEVAVVEIEPVGQAIPLTIWHAPVATLQQMVLGGTQGLIGVQVDPTPPQTPGAGQAAGPDTIVHTFTPDTSVQHAPLLGGGHGFVGTHVVPLESVVPLHGEPSGTIVQFPAASQQAYRFAIPGHGFGMHDVIAEFNVPLQLAGVYTITQLLLMSQQNFGGHGVGVQAAKLPNHPAGHPSPGKFEHAPVEALQQFVLAGGHGLGVHVVLVESTMPLHTVPGVMSVQLPMASQHTTTGQIPAVQAVPTIVDPAIAQKRGLVTKQTFPQQHATVGPTHGALAQLVCPAWNTVPPLALQSAAVVTMHPAGLQHTPNTVAAQFAFGHPDPLPCHAPPCISHSHCVFTTHDPLAWQHAPLDGCALAWVIIVQHSAHTKHSRSTDPVMVVMVRLLRCSRARVPRTPGHNPYKHEFPAIPRGTQQIDRGPRPNVPNIKNASRRITPHWPRCTRICNCLI
jgi:hypothetical protein